MMWSWKKILGYKEAEKGERNLTVMSYIYAVVALVVALFGNNTVLQVLGFLFCFWLSITLADSAENYKVIRHVIFYSENRQGEFNEEKKLQRLKK